jgi:cytochrome c
MRSWIAAALAVASVVGLGYVHPFGDPRAEAAKEPGTLLQGANMPAEAKAVLVTKCADCHSSETRWPLYARIAPGSWLIERDIVEARKKMDLSRWEQMPEEKQQVLTAKIIQEVKNGEMPPLQYLAMHWDAKPSKADVQTLLMLGKNAGGSEAALAGDGDPVRGKAVFEKLHRLPCTRSGPGRAKVGRSVRQKGRDRAGVYVLSGAERLRADMDGCYIGKVVERSGSRGTGKQYELQRSQSRRAPRLDCLPETR